MYFYLVFLFSSSSSKELLLLLKVTNVTTEHQKTAQNGPKHHEKLCFLSHKSWKKAETHLHVLNEGLCSEQYLLVSIIKCFQLQLILKGGRALCTFLYHIL